MMEYAALLAAGAAIGFLGGLFGIGGGLLATPMLALCYGFSQAEAQGTALLVAAANVSVGIVRYRRYHALPVRLATVIALSAVLPNALGGWIGVRVPNVTLRLAFAGLLVVLALISLRRSQTLSSPVEWKALPAAILGACTGLLNGIFGAGGGLVAVPVLRATYKLSQTAAQALLLFISLPIILPGLVSYARSGNVDWRTGLLLAASGVLTVPAGARLAHRVSDATLRNGFALVLVSAAALLIFRSR